MSAREIFVGHRFVALDVFQLRTPFARFRQSKQAVVGQRAEAKPIALDLRANVSGCDEWFGLSCFWFAVLVDRNQLLQTVK